LAKTHSATSHHEEDTRYIPNNRFVKTSRFYNRESISPQRKRGREWGGDTLHFATIEGMDIKKKNNSTKTGEGISNKSL